MNMESQAQQLQNFLSRYTNMWNVEIMNEYPQSLEFYPKEWVELLSKLSEEELYAIDCKKTVKAIKGSSFEKFMNEAKALTKIEAIPELPDIPVEDWAFNGVKKKKEHEIQKIVPVLKKIKDSINFEYIVDIGGGVGHLSRVLSHYHSIPSISIDRNPEFQKIGLQRLSKYRKVEGSRDVKFVNLDFSKSEHFEILKNIFKPQAFSLGLHTCGALANTLIQKSIDYKLLGLLSFGCCYHTLRPDIDFPISDYYKKLNFQRPNLYSFTLATRAHAEINFKDYQTKERVKYYRYALHLFLIQHFNQNNFISVGDEPIRTYWGDLSDYIKNKLNKLNIKHDFSDHYFNLFYESPEIQKELRTMWICNIIRWQLGLCLEVFLLLDRCLYLQEKGYKVEMRQYFQDTISPRNIGILAVLK